MTPEKSSYGLENHGFTRTLNEHWNLPTSALYEHIIRAGEGRISNHGSLVVSTGQYTGRTPKDKFIVQESDSEGHIWWGPVNRPISPEYFERLKYKVLKHFEYNSAYVQDLYTGADTEFGMPVRIITEKAWHSLFVRNMFIRPPRQRLASHIPEYTVIDAPSVLANPDSDGTRSSAFILLNLQEKLVIIGGTSYAGEIKKSVFSIMNYLMPFRDVLPMHCSANYGDDPDDAAIFFGLSGTGKTTLSSDTTRMLVGDDEHGWSSRGVFNFEGGCYAKVIRLDAKGEPEIYQTTRQFGTVLENVVMDPDTRRVDLDDPTFTENTRAVYDISQIPTATCSGVCGHPRHIFFLTADAFGVLPPISRLTPAQAQYHFLSGYTAKVAGTEKGLSSQPEATFSTCFGAPFMVHHPTIYAALLDKRIEQYGANVWLVNTGWTGGPANGEGHRMRLEYTRAMIRAALSGQLDDVETVQDPVFGVCIPVHVPDVPDELLHPRETWADEGDYDRQAALLAEMFRENFTQFEDRASPEVRAAGPVFGAIPAL